MAKNQGYDITSQRFDKLLVLGKGESKGLGRTTWNCRCDCGNEKPSEVTCSKTAIQNPVANAKGVNAP